MPVGKFDFEDPKSFKLDYEKVLHGTDISLFMCPDPECKCLHMRIDHEGSDLVSVMSIPPEDVDKVAENFVRTRNIILQRKGGFSS